MRALALAPSSWSLPPEPLAENLEKADVAELRSVLAKVFVLRLCRRSVIL